MKTLSEANPFRQIRLAMRRRVVPYPTCDQRRAWFRCPRLHRRVFWLCSGLFVAGFVYISLPRCMCGHFIWSRHGNSSQANESNAVASLKYIISAQAEYATSGNGGYADSADLLASRLYPPTAAALGPGGTPYQEYRFSFIYFRDGQLINLPAECPGVCAWPVAYGKTALNTFVVLDDGVVLMKDNGGKPVRDMSEIDGTWAVP